ETLVPVRSEVDMPGLGKLLLVRTTESVARAPAGSGSATLDIGITQLIRTNQRIAHPYETESAVYRITVKGDAEAATTFAQDERQSVRNVKGDTFELVVRARRQPAGKAPAKPVGAEFLESNYFITCGDARVQDLARKAVGAEPDGWQKALKIE